MFHGGGYPVSSPEARTRRASALPGIMLAAPGVAVTLAVLAFAGLELRGTTPLSYGRPRNVAEAAALGQASEVLRLLSEGQDPNREWPLRKQIISSSVLKATALEAAVWSRQGELIQLLDARGAVPHGDERRHLTCLASDLRIDEIVEFLSPDGPPACEPEQAMESIQLRSRPR